MRCVPSVSRRTPAPVSCHRTRRPARSDVNQPAAAVRASAWRAVLSSTPHAPSDPTSVPVHTGAPAGSTNSPRIVISSERALGRAVDDGSTPDSLPDVPHLTVDGHSLDYVRIDGAAP